MHEKRYHGDGDRLRSPERIERLEVPRVIAQSMAGIELTSVLDVGTGTGLFAEEFSKVGLRVQGVDANPEMAAAAARHVPGAQFSVSTAEALPFEDRSFDLVFMGLVFHETDDPLEALREALRIASKRVAILEWPHREQDYGPPISTLSAPAPRRMELDSVDLYLIDKA